MAFHEWHLCNRCSHSITWYNYNIFLCQEISIQIQAAELLIKNEKKVPSIFKQVHFLIWNWCVRGRFHNRLTVHWSGRSHGRWDCTEAWPLEMDQVLVLCEARKWFCGDERKRSSVGKHTRLGLGGVGWGWVGWSEDNVRLIWHGREGWPKDNVVRPVGARPENPPAWAKINSW